MHVRAGKRIETKMVGLLPTVYQCPTYALTRSDLKSLHDADLSRFRIDVLSHVFPFFSFQKMALAVLILVSFFTIFLGDFN